jgi:GNAT superfamily N-acetyltransferase
MKQHYQLKRTTAENVDFVRLISLLDHELWMELKEDQATYDQFNKVPDLQTVVLVYVGDEPVACGCFKHFNADTIEVKRMYVKKAFRGKGLSKLVLHELETWAKEKGYHFAVLETSVHFTTARNLYESCHYQPIPNYPPYQKLDDSICMKKDLFASSK